MAIKTVMDGAQLNLERASVTKALRDLMERWAWTISQKKIEGSRIGRSER